MTNYEFLKNLAFIASVVIPLFNVPLIARMIQRKSSADLSMVWLFGVLSCLLLMLPYGIVTEDQVMKYFAIVNASVFSIVVLVAVFFRIKN